MAGHEQGDWGRNGLERSPLIDDILVFLEGAGELASCMIKTSATPLYAAFYEMWEGKSFCDDSDLDFFDRAIAGIELGAEGSSKLGIKLGGGVSIVLGLKRVFRAAAPLFKKLRNIDFGETAEMIISIVKFLPDVKFANIISKIKNIFQSAKVIGAKTGAGVREFAEVLSKYKIETPNWPNGINFNSNLKKHMSQLDGFTQKAGVKGAHNANAFQSAINSKGARVVNTIEHPRIPGVKNVDYEIPKLDRELNPIPGEFKGGFSKTVYDPAVIPDGEMLRLGQIASAEGYETAVSAGKRIYSGKAGGLDFTVYLKNGVITNVHPRFPQ